MHGASAGAKRGKGCAERDTAKTDAVERGNFYMEETRNPSLQEKREKALALFAQGYNCAQAVAGACAPCYGIAEKDALRLTAGLGGGLAGSHREACGAVMGAVMALGASLEDDSPEAKKQANALGKRALADFQAKNGSVNCAELLRQPDIKSASAADPRLHAHPGIRPCARFVLDAVEIVHDIAEEDMGS